MKPANEFLENGENEVVYIEAPVKSESDKKEYKVIKLKNGLTALLISDMHSLQDEKSGTVSKKYDCDEEPEILSDEDDKESGDEDDDDGSGSEDSETEDITEEKMAACSLCINVGSFSDPMEIQGLAHFLEHMVFMGSEKYPQENDYDAFIRNRGGSNNACTDSEHTTFYFEIQEKHLLPALDRFAQFFIKPLMCKDAIKREREAVDSEFKMALSSDSNRKDQLFGSFAQKNHPMSKFSWGNLVTLKDNIDDDTLYSELQKFHERHYSANRMKLAVQARLPLETLEKYVAECFKNVPVNHLPPDDFISFKDINTLLTPNFKKFYKIKPIKDMSKLELTWVLPSLLNHYKSKPHQYISWIIGHEGEGSLVSYLREKMWCFDLESGNSESDYEHNSLYTLFTISLKLTDQGLENLNKVLEAVFSYLNLVSKEVPQKRIFDEIQQIENINFKFCDEVDPVEYVENLSEDMHIYNPVDYITGGNLYFEYDPESIRNCALALNPENVNIILFDTKFNQEEFDQIEPWFKTKYTCFAIPEDWIKSWKIIKPFEYFHLPKPNKFITTDFNLISLPAEISSHPTKIRHNDQAEIWYRPDPKFRFPDCYINMYLKNHNNFTSAKTAAISDLFVSILHQIVKKDLYDATVAELHYNVYNGPKGMIVKVHGFNQKLPLLLKTVMHYIKNCCKLTENFLFNAMKKEQLKVYYNAFLKPEKLNTDVRLSILQTVYYTAMDKHYALSFIDYKEFIDFAENICKNLYIQCLVQGNITQDDTLSLIDECIDILQCKPLSKELHPKIVVNEIENGQKFCKVKNINLIDVNSVVTNYYQSGFESINEKVIIELLIMIMEEPLFNILRTQEQLGYYVYCELKNTFDILGFSITVCHQADKFTSEHVNERIENFLTYIVDTLKNMPKVEFGVIKTSLIQSKLIADFHIREEVQRNWNEIECEKYIFDRLNKEINAISTIQINDIINWLTKHLVNGENFKKLSIQVEGCIKSDKENEIIGENEINSPNSAKKYSLSFLTSNKISLDSYVSDISEYKKQLGPYTNK